MTNGTIEEEENDMEPTTPVPREDANRSACGNEVLLGDEDIADDENEDMEDTSDDDE